MAATDRNELYASGLGNGEDRCAAPGAHLAADRPELDPDHTLVEAGG
jgi:hypothetical protein